MEIRPETVRDYAAIAGVNVRAFGNRSSEALIVALHRHARSFDPSLSLVAERSDRVVGHVLFTPHVLRILGQAVPAVNLAPIAIEPIYQGQGLGRKLIEEGHRVAQGRGYALSFLLGHTDYYPRFGYLTHAFGSSSLVTTAGAAADQLASRQPTDADLPALQELWLCEEGQVDMAVAPGPDLLDWLSPNPAVAALVWLKDNAVVGYTRTHAADQSKPRVFLAASHAIARSIAVALTSQAAENASPSPLILPLHPASASAGAFGVPRAESWPAAMVCPLRPSPFDDYYAAVRVGQRAPGRPIWPVAFDLE